MAVQNPRLLFDEMLKSACTWMRIFGIDSTYGKGRGDSELLKAALEDGYALITRDAELAKRCSAKGGRCVLVRSVARDGQLAQVAKELGLEFRFPEETRCPACNGELKQAGKKDAKGRVPEKVYAQNKEFWACGGCGKVYWRGGHWVNITRIFKNVEAALGQTNKKQ